MAVSEAVAPIASLLSLVAPGLPKEKLGHRGTSGPATGVRSMTFFPLGTVPIGSHEH
jgi:hypothetical protein